jgi:hypothetical protein
MQRIFLLFPKAEMPQTDTIATTRQQHDPP